MSSSLIWEQASPAQHGMWVTDRLGGDPRAHHMPIVVRLTGELDLTALELACTAVLRRHPGLGKALADRDGMVGLVPAWPSGLIVYDLSGPSAPDVEEELTREIGRGFDLGHGPLIRFTLFQLGAGRNVLLIVAHHAVFDGVSKDLLVRDLAQAYGGATLPEAPSGSVVPSDGEISAPSGSIVPSDEEITAAGDFWRTRWHDPAELALPGLTGLSLRATPAESIDLDLGPLPEDLALTRFETLVAALLALLHGYRPGPVALAVDLSTRGEQHRDTVGLFANEVPVFWTPDPADTFAQHARGVRAELREIYRHRRVPVARALSGISPRAALAPFSLSYRKRSDADPVFGGLGSSVEWMAANGAIRNTVHLQVVDGVGARLSYDPACLDRASAELVASDLQRLLASVTAAPYQRLRDLPRGHAAAVARLASPAENGSAAVATPVDHETLAVMTSIWCEVLGIDDVHPDDDLFDLGGHSLTITQIIARVDKRLGVELTLDTFFETPTLAELVTQVEAARTS
ncbi:condensation domain-containing protein [Acrocarpospora catenulata]|uniref:condensation domain-containing protein n=1 Tax=Acrocarpospora catenulata TaxID=2836182 RepID=UPI001BD95456|nr:condensation domain-containing protein [Acrocarpospora catenulata]